MARIKITTTTKKKCQGRRTALTDVLDFDYTSHTVHILYLGQVPTEGGRQKRRIEQWL